MRFRLLFFFVFLHTFSVSAQQLDTIQINQLFKQIDKFEKKNNFSAILGVADTILLVTDNNYKNIIIKATLAKSKALWNTNEYHQAMQLSKQAMLLANDNNIEKLKADIWFNHASIYRKTNEKNKAIDAVLKSLVLYEKYNNKKGIASAYVLIGILKSTLGDFEKGINYFEKALTIHRKINDKEHEIHDLLDIGTTYFFSDNLMLAKKYFLQALSLKPLPKDKNILLMNTATVYQHLKQLDSAYYYQIKAIKNTKKLNDDYILSTLFYNAATVKFEQKDLDSTYYYASEGLRLSKKLNRFDRQIDNMLMLSQVDSVKGNIRNELAVFKKIIPLKDSILQQERKNIAHEIESKYENLKKDEIIKWQNKNLSIANEKNKFLKLSIIIGSLLFLLLLLLVYTYRKLLRQSKKVYQIEKKQMLESLKNKEQELVAIALQIEQKNQLIAKFYQKLKNASLQSDTTKEDVNTILNEVKASVNVQKDIKLFSKKFADLHHDFISKLKQKHPELSIKEINFLSFIKIGLSNKQIAVMQNITPAAVHKMRYRIKKKINLTSEQSLDDFVMSF